ncbi:hypothetical protein VM636_01020 [Streptomyces sp. SCSIO 75703]|uniref:hypothetical protein n=1 Tax=unclassified Streptomyces TaxID=2593676 RepID=UPI0004C233DC|nr:hypothetical protein [Streptomyces sp. NRRL F-5065]
MSHHGDPEGKKPGTAVEEVLGEVEDAETRDPESARERRQRGEAGDALSPGPGAQEDAGRE